MKIIDIRQNHLKDTTSAYFEPLRDLNEFIICRRCIEAADAIYIDGFYKYNINNTEFRRIDSTNSHIDFTALWYYYKDKIYFSTSQGTNNKNTIIFHELDLHNEMQREVMKLHLTSDQRFFLLEIIENTFIYLIEDGSDKNANEKSDSECYHVYVYDFVQNETYEIKDKALRSSIGFFEAFKRESNQNFMIEEKYMEEWEKEDIYKKKLFGDSSSEIYTDSIKVINYNDFVAQAKQGVDTIKCIDIDTKELDGAISYIIMDDSNIYYRRKDFVSGKLELVSLNMNTLEKTIYPLPKCYNYIKIANKHIFAIHIKENIIIAKDIADNNIILSYPKTIHEIDGDEAFFDFIEERYLIIEGWEEIAGDMHNYSKIYDIETGEVTKNNSYVSVIKDKVILY